MSFVKNPGSYPGVTKEKNTGKLSSLSLLADMEMETRCFGGPIIDPDGDKEPGELDLHPDDYSCFVNPNIQAGLVSEK